MTPTRDQVLAKALTLFRGADDQADEHALADARAVIESLSWCAQDKDEVRKVFDALVAAGDDTMRRQQVLHDYSKGTT